MYVCMLRRDLPNPQYHEIPQLYPTLQQSPKTLCQDKILFVNILYMEDSSTYRLWVPLYFSTRPNSEARVESDTVKDTRFLAAHTQNIHRLSGVRKENWRQYIQYSTSQNEPAKMAAHFNLPASRRSSGCQFWSKLNVPVVSKRTQNRSFMTIISGFISWVTPPASRFSYCNRSFNIKIADSLDEKISST